MVNKYCSKSGEVTSVSLLFLLLGFIPLLYGATIMVDSSTSLARRMNVPNIVIGLTIVAFGTSSPELLVNLFSSYAGSSELALGNVIGSNIFNTFLILGISALIVPLAVKSNTVWIEIPLSLLAALVVLVLVNDRYIEGVAASALTRVDGLTLFFFFLIFLGYNLKMMLGGTFSEEIAVKDYTVLTAILLLLLGLVLLFVGGRVIVVFAVELAREFGLAERIIALTIVSAGTSLPELATSIVAARKKNFDIAVGNIVGSNIFNIFFILGISAIIAPIPLQSGANLDLMVNLTAGLLLFVFMFTGKGRRLERWEGALFILLYLVYLGFLIF
jgi:cation:H+ antiporter